MCYKLLDTGIRTAAENIALDSILLEARAKGKIPNTLRFLQFSPPAVLVGYHQTIGQEVRVEFCRQHGIDVNRRITGGGAIYFDESQLGWELIASKADIGYRLDKVTERVCEAVTRGLKILGVDAKFRPRNDIEVNGRKISGTGGIFEDGAVLFQGTLLVDFDVETMMRALRIPTEKLADRELASVRERVTCLREELGVSPPLKEIKQALQEGFEQVLGIEFRNCGLRIANCGMNDFEKNCGLRIANCGMNDFEKNCGLRIADCGLNDFEQELLGQKRAEFASKDWIESTREPIDNRQILKGSHRAKGGLIRVSAVMDVKRRMLKQALVSGDFFISPVRTIFDMESLLKDVPCTEVSQKIEQFFKDRQPQMPDLSWMDFASAFSSAIDKVEYPGMGIPLEEANHLFTVNGTLHDILKSPSVLLLPYCAKLVGCEYRYNSGCVKCGGCSVGTAYELAEKHGLAPITIQNYKHLQTTLQACKRDGVKSYIGCCCEAFFARRQRAFREIGIPCVLLDIENSTCYELDKETEGLAGEFENQTHLRLNLLERVLDHANNL
ncbi:MAG: DUF116 domain-containing protein [Candidatus Desantisbacteria bacterium]